MASTEEKKYDIQLTEVNPEKSAAVGEDAAEYGKKGTKKTKPKRTTKKVSYFQLFRYATSLDYLLLFIGAIGAMAAGSAMPLSTKIFGKLINEFALYQQGLLTQDQVYATIDEYTLYFVALFAGTLICTYIYSAFYVFSGERQTRKLRTEYLKSVLRQDVAFYDKVGAGEIISRLTSDTILVQDGISEKLSFFIMNISTAIAGYVIAFTVSAKMTGVIFCIVPVLILVVGLTNRVAARYTRKSLDYYSFSGTIAEEVLASIRTVVAFGAEKKMTDKYVSKLTDAEKAGIKKNVAAGMGAGGIFLVMFCGYSLAFFYGGILVADGEIGPGDVLNVFFAVLIGSFALGHSAPDISAFNFAMGAGGALFETIDRISPIDSLDDKGLKKPDSEVQGTIKLVDVNFRYPTRPELHILKGINIEVAAGNTVALVGSSGSGKSTILQLIERFYDPESGQVLFDGKPIPEYNLGWLRNQIGIVSQEPVLFSGSIADNVANGLAGTSSEKLPREEQMKLIIDACKLANCHDFIMKLPKQYETDVGERGHLLSGGQKQRVAIARSVVKGAKVLLLDEATSALDSASEAIVQAALDKASVGRTTIVVAHRLSTIMNADLIVVMDKGAIVETGSHKCLMANESSYYRRLVEAQKFTQHQEKPDPEKSPERKPDEPIPGIVTVDDPAISPVETSSHDVEKQTEITYTDSQVYRRIMGLNSPELYLIFLGAFSAVAAGLVFPIFSIIFGGILEVFANANPDYVRTESRKWALYFVVIAIAAFIANTLQNTLFGISGERLTTRIRSMLFGSLLFQEIGFFDANTTGGLCSRLSTEALLIQGVTGAAIGTFLNVTASMVAGVVIAFVYGWELTLVVLATLPLLIASSTIRMRIINGYNEQTKRAYEKSSSVASESVAAIKTVQTLTMESLVMHKYDKNLEEPSASERKHAFIGSIAYAFSQSINFLVNALAFWYGGGKIVSGEYTIQNMFTVFMAIIFGSMSAGRAFAFGPDVGKAKSSARYILANLDRKSKIDARVVTENRHTVTGNVKFEKVQFEYPTRAGVILKGIDMEIKAGQTVALVGQSGCGKSTTIQLMERYYDPTVGKIFIDGVPIKDFDVKEYRSFVSIVGQEPNLYTGTIKDNILFGTESATQEEIEKAAKEANIHDFIVTLPQGYDTDLGSKGTSLSGGQKQRIAICRALIRNPKILLLDEATSALDSESERVVQAALDAASKGRTTIVIAHRLSTIQNADLINVFSEGRIVERGTHDELVKQNGLYTKMVEAQNLLK